MEIWLLVLLCVYTMGKYARGEFFENDARKINQISVLAKIVIDLV